MSSHDEVLNLQRPGPWLPDGDILIHAGDLTQSGSLRELQSTLTWLKAQLYPIKIVLAGNHELLLVSNDDKSHISDRGAAERAQLDWGDITYLGNEVARVCCANGRCLEVYGSLYFTRHGNRGFQCSRSQDVWATSVPDGIDILITHSPPLAHHDVSFGFTHLLQTLWKVEPRLHVIGHVREGAGTVEVLFNRLQDAYERTIAAGGGIRNLLFTAWELAKTYFWPALEAKDLLVISSDV
ncbi:hypothetical protein N7486_005631 [Penicillium sp. IBT 16267x]|nr:hypothetical protein N7486_005631 [Penicillium sp. IBT 16267x]